MLASAHLGRHGGAAREALAAQGLAVRFRLAPAKVHDLEVRSLLRGLVEAREGRAAGPVVLPAAALSIALVSFALNIPGNALSRQVERSADGHALNLDRDPAAFIGVERKLVTQNVADPDPPGWLQLLFGTHPKTVDRIGYAITWSREH